MTKGELRTLIREVINEELSISKTLKEEIEGPTYVIRAWDNPGLKGKSMPNFDSGKSGKKYPDFDDVLAALKSGDLDGKGAYEIIWVQSGQTLE